MSHTCNHQYIHLIWATKNLEPSIVEDHSGSLLAYISGILKNIGGKLLVSSALPNHIHLLVNIPTDISVADLMRQIKACSSKWYNEEKYEHKEFQWNQGYSAFTVSPSSIENVRSYLASEETRHRNQFYENELTGFLKLHEIEFNPTFLTNTTYTRLVYHFVWSVKNRIPFLDKPLQPLLHQCLLRGIEDNGCKLLAIGNVSDHIHMLVECSSKIKTAQLVQHLKTTTCHLIKAQDKEYAKFSWQEGFGVFSVGRPALKVVTNYVNNQEIHHNSNQKTFEQEWDWLIGAKSVSSLRDSVLI